MTTQHSESSRTTTTVCEPDSIDEAALNGEHASADESATTPAEVRARRWYRPQWTVAKLTFVAGLSVVIALAGWLAYRSHQADEAVTLKAQFVQVASRGALSLTTIDWEHADADVTRILDSASGSFHDDFANDRSRSSKS